MRFRAGLAIAAVLLAASAGAAAAQGTRAFEACAKAALQQAMLVRSVIAQSDLRDAGGAIVGTKVDLDVNALGKKQKVSCYYTAATRVAVIRQYREGNPSDDRAQRNAVRACQRAAQQQKLMLDGVVSQRDIRDRRGRLTGREVVIAVYHAGKPAQVVCAYDYAAQSTALELRRPAFR